MNTATRAAVRYALNNGHVPVAIRCALIALDGGRTEIIQTERTRAIWAVAAPLSVGARRTGPATAMHIHGSVGPGTNGSVLFPLTSLHLPAADPAKGGIIFGGVPYTEADASNLLAGLHYINVHTTSNPGGEIRGQLIPVPNHAPSVTCPDPAALECASPNGTPASVSVKVEDADGDALQVV